MELGISTDQSREEFLMEYGSCRISIKRDDLIHPTISGNKWRKLKYHLEEFYRGDYEEILSFGGAFSNHLAALATLGNLAQIPTHAMVRGEEAGNSPTLDYCRNQGMQWEAISRKNYQLKEDPLFLALLHEWKECLYIIPEGGKGAPAVKGCAELIDELNKSYDYIALAAGTGTTAAGLLSHADCPKLLVYPALKGGSFLSKAIGELLFEHAQHYKVKPPRRALLRDKLELRNDYHFGGFGKVKPELVTFMNKIHADNGLKLDPIYTAKLVFGLLKDIDQGKCKAGSSILVLHSGGLQGIAGMNLRLAKKSQELIAYE
jgi:1-aminocyclopropane-1-carboxylate deaminase